MDLFLQLLDAARITIATGETLDFSGFYVVMTTNLGSAELMSLQQMGNALADRLLAGLPATGLLTVDEPLDCLVVH